jgi:hypothetical protein
VNTHIHAPSSLSHHQTAHVDTRPRRIVYNLPTLLVKCQTPHIGEPLATHHSPKVGKAVRVVATRVERRPPSVISDGTCGDVEGKGERGRLCDVWWVGTVKYPTQQKHDTHVSPHQAMSSVIIVEVLRRGAPVFRYHVSPSIYIQVLCCDSLMTRSLRPRSDELQHQVCQDVHFSGEKVRHPSREHHVSALPPSPGS